ncbi:MAG TPA: hypothetical protein ENI85_07645 [Deltaproteobacteria bacterium]|nr:hypothetical protein [Deltaproteobacteria bacterium]
MRRRIFVMAVALVTLVLVGSGCVSGAIYSHTTVPLDVNFEGAPRASDHRGPSWKTLSIPIYYGRLRFDWGSTAIADAARRAGIETVQYADLETLSVLGVWTQRTIHVYGE